jgi:hypothetical protein
MYIEPSLELGFPAGMIPEYKGALIVGRLDSIDKLLSVERIDLFQE